MLEAFVESEGAAECRSVERVIASGEALSGALVRRFYERLSWAELHNLYGPTETAVDVTAHRCERREGTNVPIGKPIANTRIYILDEQLRSVPAGATGEIYIGGVQVGRGYLNRAELTRARFLEDPYSDEAGARMYKSGDVGRYRADGSIEYLGRNDDQVKVRGHRIELGEIEARLREQEGVREAVVVARGEGADKQLVAYLTARAGFALRAEAMRGELVKRVPEYMVPAAYVVLEELPLTVNGKVDRRRLPEAEEWSYARSEYEAPRGEVEERVSKIWSELLRVERVGREDSFFELGGHSLLAVRLISRVREELGVELPLREVFTGGRLRDVAAAVERAEASRVKRIEALGRPTARLSYGQKRLWFLSQLSGVSEGYHMPACYCLKGELDVGALKGALDGIWERHEALRTRFEEAAGGEPEQRVMSATEGFALEVVELGEGRDVREEVREEVERGFDLKRGPMIRGKLLRVGESEHVLVITAHHIVSDGWSMGVMTRELSELYAKKRRGERGVLPVLEVQYGDYAEWQSKNWGEKELKLQGEYWAKQLRGAPEVLELPKDRARPEQQELSGGVVRIELDSKQTRKLKELSLQRGATLYMTLLAGWAGVLSRLSGQETVVIGTPVANRPVRELEGLIGFFVNTLALRVDIGRELKVSELLEQVKLRVLEAQQHQDVPFEQVVELVKPGRSLAYTPLFQVMFAWQNNEVGGLALSGLEVEEAATGYEVAKFDLTLSLSEQGEQIVGGVEYARSLFERETVERYVGYLERLIEGMLEGGERRVSEIEIVGELERRRVVEEWNRTEREYATESCIHELIEEQAGKRRDATAVEYGERALTYETLNERANRLAHHLRKRGVKPDSRVGLCVERSLELVQGVLGILKAGGAYVPLDPSYPLERLRYMVEDSEPELVLTYGADAQVLSSELKAGGIQVLDLEHDAGEWTDEATTNPERGALTSQNLAYVIYTSGSTGKPKGVMVEHGGVCNLAAAQIAAFGVEPESRVLQYASLSFDACVSELAMALCRGATLVVPQAGQVWAGRDLAQLMQASQITHITLPPTVLASLPEEFRFEALQTLIVAGEALRAQLAEHWAKRHKLINAYGPTEATVCATLHECSKRSGEQPPIGRPMANVRLYILDDHGVPVPTGVAGEIAIGGAGVARGYWKRPELSAERFVVDPFAGSSGARMYKTGDVARYRKNGEIEFLGRRDEQVKLRGLRIELGEIETRMTELEGVKQAAVIAREDVLGQARLVAYYSQSATDEARLSPEQLREHLAVTLPEYMLPSAYVCLPELPLSPNGKLDRKVLTAQLTPVSSARAYERPIGPTETKLARLWTEVLGVSQVGRHDHFFELGGHSLLAITLLERMRREGLHAKVRDVLGAGSLAALAKTTREMVEVSL